MTNAGCRILTAETFRAKNGALTVVEGEKTVPFAIRRVFFLYDLKPGDVRGRHAVQNGQCVFLLCGACKIRVHDGRDEAVFSLDAPGAGLYIPAMVWRELFGFAGDCRLAVFSDAHYDPAAYLDDFDEFLRRAKEGSL